MLQGTKDVLLFPPEEKARLVNPEGIGECSLGRPSLRWQIANLTSISRPTIPFDAVEIKGSLESKSRVLRNPHFAEADCAEPDGRAAEATAMRCVAQVCRLCAHLPAPSGCPLTPLYHRLYVFRKAKRYSFQKGGFTTVRTV